VVTRYAAVGRPFPGLRVSGDGCLVKRFEEYDLFAVVDGLGHGSQAHAVTARCLSLLEEHGHRDLGEIVTRCHEGLKRGRGAAMAVARIWRSGMRLEHLSVGNVDTRVANTPQPQRPYCFNGTLGMNIEGGARVLEYPLAPGAVVVMCTDGILSRFQVEEAAAAGSPAEAAARILEGFRRGTDDALVLVVKVG